MRAAMSPTPMPVSGRVHDSRTAVDSGNMMSQAMQMPGTPASLATARNAMGNATTHMVVCLATSSGLPSALISGATAVGIDITPTTGAISRM